MWLLAYCLFAQADEGSLCVKDEKVIFSCATKDKKVISICATPVLTMETGTLSYRFGTTGKVEIEFPKNKNTGTKSFRYSRYTRPLPMATTILSLSFTHSDGKYTIFSHTHCENDDPCEESSGVRLENGKTFQEQSCVSTPKVNALWDLEGLVQQE